MDLYTRGLLLAGLFGVMLVLAGVALLIGRAQQRSKQAKDRFDVGKGRRRQKRKTKKKEKREAKAPRRSGRKKPRKSPSEGEEPVAAPNVETAPSPEAEPAVNPAAATVPAPPTGAAKVPAPPKATRKQPAQKQPARKQPAAAATQQTSRRNPGSTMPFVDPTVPVPGGDTGASPFAGKDAQDGEDW